MLTYIVYLEKCIHAKITLKNLIQRKKLSIQHPFTHCLQTVHLMQQKIISSVTDGKTVRKGFEKT